MSFNKRLRAAHELRCDLLAACQRGLEEASDFVAIKASEDWRLLERLFNRHAKASERDASKILADMKGET
jgi:hypothetical protein